MWSLNHWSTREVPLCLLYLISSFWVQFFSSWSWDNHINIRKKWTLRDKKEQYRGVWGRLPQNVLLSHVDYFELKISRPSRVRKTFIFNLLLNCLKEFKHGACTRKRVIIRDNFFNIRRTYLHVRVNIYSLLILWFVLLRFEGPHPTPFLA